MFFYNGFVFSCVPPPTPMPGNDGNELDLDNCPDLSNFFDQFDDQPENDVHLNFPAPTPMPQLSDD